MRKIFLIGGCLMVAPGLLFAMEAGRARKVSLFEVQERCKLDMLTLCEFNYSCCDDLQTLRYFDLEEISRKNRLQDYRVLITLYCFFKNHLSRVIGDAKSLGRDIQYEMENGAPKSDIPDALQVREEYLADQKYLCLAWFLKLQEKKEVFLRY